MTTLGQIYDYIDGFAPFRNQDSFDNSGICVGGREDRVTKILLALDATNRVVDEAEALDCDLIVTHHPVIFNAIKHIDAGYPAGRALAKGISCLGCHTSLDSAPYGVSDMMVDILGFENLGITPEYNRRDPVNGEPVGYGAMAKCPPMTAKELAALAKERFKSAGIRWVDGGREITKVACGSGACSDILASAAEKGAQALVTGDVKLSVFLEAERIGMTLIDAGHYETEVIALPYLAEKLGDRFGIECVVSSADGIVRGIDG